MNSQFPCEKVDVNAQKPWEYFSFEKNMIVNKFWYMIKNKDRAYRKFKYKIFN